jgi:hypothetical protein
MVVPQRETQVGLVRRLLNRAVRATAWMGAA